MKRLLFALTIILALNVALAANVDLDQLDIAKFSLTTDEEKTKEKKYSYNWPYDFFSLVELLKVESEMQVSSIMELYDAAIVEEDENP